MIRSGLKLLLGRLLFIIFLWTSAVHYNKCHFAIPVTLRLHYLALNESLLCFSVSVCPILSLCAYNSKVGVGIEKFDTPICLS